ncbi:MAG: HlyC/CorC family transporter [Candidatus Eisenbacteria bacterium]|uniref:HlyC/CorC family transporter n=1 Tax=Eiseniibacteriota bacterium TaxID=2212470 RepID=A0A937X9F4_UNCEI|nr:HlyC/CorC family transporter [Candidatus Eisenbacteria bacterium]
MEPLLLACMLGLLLCSAFFSATEAALFSLTRLQIHQLRERRDRASRRLLKLLERPERTLAVLLVGNNLTSIALSAFATAGFLMLLQDRGRALAWATLTVTAAVLIFGEITPKTLAMGAPAAVARLHAGGFGLAEKLLGPLRTLLYGLAGWLLRALKLPREAPGPGGLLTQAELRALLRETDEEGGAITSSEARLVQNILEFPGRTAEEVMTPRIDLVDLAVDAPEEAIVAEMRASRHSRYPVHTGDTDNVVGFVQAKEYLLDPGRGLRACLRPAAFFPKTARVDRIFQEMQRTRTGLAMIVNEHGEVVGLVTREDVVEEIVGDIYDEFDLEATPIRRKGEGLFVVPGRIALAELNGHLDLSLPEESAVTLSGFLCGIHGRIPRPGMVIAWEGFRFHILEVARHRVQSALLELPDRAGDGEEA